MSNLPAGISDFSSWATPEEEDLLRVVLEAGQAHVFKDWQVGADEAQKHAFFAQVATLEKNYPGGIRKYAANARKLLEMSAAGETTLDGYGLETPTLANKGGLGSGPMSGAVAAPGGELVKYDYGTPDFVAAETRGLANVKNCAFVLVAGGLGERLGYSDIKLSLPVQSLTEQCYLELYVQQILAFEAHATAANGGVKVAPLPLAIMTSDDTHAKTVALLAEKKNFGAAEGQVTIIKQEKVPSLVDNEAHFAMEAPYVIETKPHGHGDVHALLHTSGLARKWDAEGRTHLVFFQDTNALCFTVTIAALGASVEHGFHVNSICIPRKAKDAVGAIARLRHTTTGKVIVVNVEYNELEPLMASPHSNGRFPGGDKNAADGFSPFPGNINQLIFHIPSYAAVLATTGGHVPEFVNPKYADATKTKFKKPTRLECMMQTYPFTMPDASKVGATLFNDWTYSPVKNALADALAKVKDGVPGRSALEGELEYYASASKALAALGVALPLPGEFAAQGFSVPSAPKIVVSPFFANAFEDWRAAFPSPKAISITNRSTLVVQGRGKVRFHGLALDGGLFIEACEGAVVEVRGLKVQNGGVRFLQLEEGKAYPDWIKIRGFVVPKVRDVKMYVFDKPGRYELTGNGGSSGGGGGGGGDGCCAAV